MQDWPLPLPLPLLSPSTLSASSSPPRFHPDPGLLCHWWPTNLPKQVSHRQPSSTNHSELLLSPSGNSRHSVCGVPLRGTADRSSLLGEGPDPVRARHRATRAGGLLGGPQTTCV